MGATGNIMSEGRQGIEALSSEQDQWERVRHRFEHEFGGKAFQTWLKPLSFSALYLMFKLGDFFK